MSPPLPRFGDALSCWQPSRDAPTATTHAGTAFTDDMVFPEGPPVEIGPVLSAATDLQERRVAFLADRLSGGTFTRSPKLQFSYVGTRGVAVFYLSPNSTCVQKREIFLFENASQFRSDKLELAWAFYKNVRYQYKWKSRRGKVEFHLKGSLWARHGNIAPWDPIYLGQAAYSAWQEARHRNTDSGLPNPTVNALARSKQSGR